MCTDVSERDILGPLERRERHYGTLREAVWKLVYTRERLERLYGCTLGPQRGERSIKGMNESSQRHYGTLRGERSIRRPGK